MDAQNLFKTSVSWIKSRANIVSYKMGLGAAVNFSHNYYAQQKNEMQNSASTKDEKKKKSQKNDCRRGRNRR